MQVKLGEYFVDSTSTEALSTVLFPRLPVDRHCCGEFFFPLEELGSLR
jgi:hypothetical protein